ncbi:Chaperone protein dnaJ 11, chloroplastic [Ananas comosus]|uniref:Chaperone protein dnaJ 11, chloroplastic n=1 Tax=Ananas comosus TaxID=4615 RepID=A0A199ULP0_ANACO|nr:Chaperone protein dnaJ 11, chloroplastic [Ananas comosus]
MVGSLTLAGFSTLRVPSFRAAAARRRAGAAPPRAMAAAVAAPPPRAGRRGRSLYQVLQVGETASAGEIKAAYRAMAKRVHPDVAAAAEGGGCGGVGVGAGPEEFLEIRRAYETLSDPTARAEYDLSIGRLRFTAAPGFRSRRWETDQCW